MRAVVGWVWALGFSGCALLSKGEPTGARFFSLETTAAPGGPRVVAPAGASAVALRMGLVSGAPHLEARLVYREADYEVGFHRDRRWTEPPEVSLERRLAYALFEARGVRAVVAGPGPTLDVALTAFEEVLAPEPCVRVRVVVRLQDAGRVLWDATLTVERPVTTIAGADPARTTVAALSEALQAVVEQVAERVVTTLVTPGSGDALSVTAE
jgi:uncharacterized lipoprotein YmbA